MEDHDSTTQTHTSGAPTGSLIQQIKELKGHDQAATSEAIALATAVVLIEVASSDQHLDKFERSIIHSGLTSLFQVSEAEVLNIIATAKNHLHNLRGSSSELQLLRESLDPVSRRAVAKLIDDLVNSHGGPQGFEIYLRNRIRTALGLPAAPPV